MLWIAFFTVWAIAEEAAKDVRRKPVSAAMEIEKHLLWDFIILLSPRRSLTPGKFRARSDVIDASTLDQPFSQSGTKNPGRRVSKVLRRNLAPIPLPGVLRAAPDQRSSS
jgi:hypothetical protein